MGYRSSASTSFTATTTLAATAPSGVVNGDRLYALVSQDGSGVTITAPAGWTSINRSDITYNNQCIELFELKNVSGTPSYTFTSSSTADTTVQVIAFSGMHTSTAATVTTALLNSGLPSPMTLSFAGITATAYASLLVFVTLDKQTSGDVWSVNTPTGFTVRESLDSNLTTVAGFTNDLVAAGTVTSPNFTAVRSTGTGFAARTIFTINIPIAPGTGSFDSGSFYAGSFDVPASGGSSKSILFGISQVETQTSSFVRLRLPSFTVAETEAINGTLRRSKPASLSISEVETLTSSIGRGKKLNFTNNEASSYMTSLNRLRLASFSVAEVEACAASIVRARTVGASIAEIEALVWDLTKTGPSGGPKDISFSVAEVLSTIQLIVRGRNTTATVTELLTDLVVASRNRNSNLVINEVQTSTFTSGRTRGSSLNIAQTETISGSLSRLRSAGLALAQTFNINLTVSRIRTLTANVAEIETFSFGTLRRTKQVASVISEIISQVDALSRTRGFTSNIAEIQVLTEAVQRVRQVQEAISVAYSTTTNLVRMRTVLAVITELEALSLSINTSAIVYKLISLLVAETETASTSAGRTRNVVWNSAADGAPSNPNMFSLPDSIGTSPWVLSAGGITSNAIANPLNGTVNAIKLFENVVAVPYIQQAVTVVGNTTYTLSVYVKAAERSNIQIRDATMALFATFDLTGVSVANVSAACTASINAVGSGWFRLTFTHSATFGSGSYSFRIQPANTSNSIAYTTLANSGIYIYGPKFEASSSASTYGGGVNNGIYETIAAALIRGRGFNLPIIENETISAGFARARKASFGFTEAEAINADITRTRGLKLVVLPISEFETFTGTISRLRGNTAGIFESISTSASGIRGRAVQFPIAEGEQYNTTLQRLKTALCSVVESQDVGISGSRLREIEEVISSVENVSFTINTFVVGPDSFNVIISWDEWITDGSVQRLQSFSTTFV